MNLRALLAIAAIGCTPPAWAQLCAAGTYSSTGSEPCTLVPAGHYQPYQGQTTYYSASPGYYQPYMGQGYVYAASPGTYVPGYAATDVILAPPGGYVPFGAASGYLLAPAGSYVPNAGASGVIPAPAGGYVPNAGATGFLLAPLGHYQPNTGQTTVIAASPGSYVPTLGAAAATLAPVGHYVASAGQSSPVAAPAGTYVPVSGAVGATVCPAGTNAYGAGSACRIVSPGYAGGAPGVTPLFGSSFGTGGTHALGTVTAGGSLGFTMGNVAAQTATPGNLMVLTLLDASIAGADGAWFSLVGYTPGMQMSAGTRPPSFSFAAGAGLPQGAFSFTLSVLTDQLANVGTAGRRFDFTFTGNGVAAVVPEPAPLVLLLAGLAVVIRARWLADRRHSA